MALMEGVLDSLRESAATNNIGKITRIKLVIGKLSMALPESLQFAFEVLSQEELFKGAALEIEEREIECRCRNCGNLFSTQDSYRFLCPECGQGQVDIISGRELYIDYYEGNEKGGPSSAG